MIRPFPDGAQSEARALADIEAAIAAQHQAATLAQCEMHIGLGAEALDMRHAAEEGSLGRWRKMLGANAQGDLVADAEPVGRDGYRDAGAVLELDRDAAGHCERYR